MASETLRDARQREIGRAWCALMGAAHGRDGMGDVYSRMINVAMVYMHSVLCGIVIQNDPCGSGCGCEGNEGVGNKHTRSEQH
jgi:hypothetical protein